MKKMVIFYLGALVGLSSPWAGSAYESPGQQDASPVMHTYCADFCPNQTGPLLNSDEQHYRTMYLDRCSRKDTFAAHCDNYASTISCACAKHADGTFSYVQGPEHSDPSSAGAAVCEPLCKSIPRS